MKTSDEFDSVLVLQSSKQLHSAINSRTEEVFGLC